MIPKPPIPTGDPHENTVQSSAKTFIQAIKLEDRPSVIEKLERPPYTFTDALNDGFAQCQAKLVDRLEDSKPITRAELLKEVLSWTYSDPIKPEIHETQHIPENPAGVTGGTQAAG